MTFNADEMFQSFKRGGARGLVISLAFAVVFGVLDQFTTRVIPWIAQTIEDVIRPPKFFVSFYPAVDVTGGLRVVDLGVDPPKEVSIKKRDLGKSGTATVFTVWAGPGTYTLQLHGAFAREGQVLSDTKEITKTDRVLGCEFE